MTNILSKNKEMLNNINDFEKHHAYMQNKPHESGRIILTNENTLNYADYKTLSENLEQYTKFLFQHIQSGVLTDDEVEYIATIFMDFKHKPQRDLFLNGRVTEIKTKDRINHDVNGAVDEQIRQYKLLLMDLMKKKSLDTEKLVPLPSVVENIDDFKDLVKSIIKNDTDMFLSDLAYKFSQITRADLEQYFTLETKDILDKVNGKHFSDFSSSKLVDLGLIRGQELPNLVKVPTTSLVKIEPINAHNTRYIVPEVTGCTIMFVQQDQQLYMLHIAPAGSPDGGMTFFQKDQSSRKTPYAELVSQLDPIKPVDIITINRDLTHSSVIDEFRNYVSNIRNAQHIPLPYEFHVYGGSLGMFGFREHKLIGGSNYDDTYQLVYDSQKKTIDIILVKDAHIVQETSITTPLDDFSHNFTWSNNEKEERVNSIVK